jgi:hypothetical protein
VCAGSEVKGFTKKGKMFLQFETNLAESIQGREASYLTNSNMSHLFFCTAFHAVNTFQSILIEIDETLPRKNPF